MDYATSIGFLHDPHFPTEVPIVSVIGPVTTAPTGNVVVSVPIGEDDATLTGTAQRSK